MKTFLKHIFARFKPRPSHTELEEVFRFYAIACAREEPVLTYTNTLRNAYLRSDPVEDLVEVVVPRLRDISGKRTKAMQARECRTLILEQVDQSVPDHFLARNADASVRHVCLAVMYNLESEQEILSRENESLMNYCETLWCESALACLYGEKFESYMPLDDFRMPYRLMSELYVRYLCTMLYSQVMSEDEGLDVKSIATAYEAACSDDTLVELGKIRSQFFEAIMTGSVDHLHSLQERFSGIARSAEATIAAALVKTKSKA